MADTVKCKAFRGGSKKGKVPVVAAGIVCKSSYDYFMVVLAAMCHRMWRCCCLGWFVWFDGVNHVGQKCMYVCVETKEWGGICLYICILKMTAAVDLWGCKCHSKIPVSLKSHSSCVIGCPASCLLLQPWAARQQLQTLATLSGSTGSF